MKIKRPVSILLCFFLMAGFLSGTALADNATLPDGHGQLYAYGDTAFSTSAGGSRGLILSLDAEQTNVVTSENYTVTCTDSLGSIDWDEGLCLWFWRANTALPGASGYITATDGTYNYSIAVTVDAPVVGVYTTSSIDSTDPGKNYVPAVNGSHMVSCVGDNAIRTLYFIPGYDFVSILANSEETPITSSNELVTCELLDSGVLAVSVSADFTGSAASSEITFFVQEFSNTPNRFDFSVTFEGEQGDNSGPLLLSASRDMTTDDYATPSAAATAAQFTFKNNAYCMTAHLAGETYPSDGGSINFPMVAGDTRLITYDIAIWVDMGNNEYSLVTDEALLAEMEAAFGDTLQLQIHASDSHTVPQRYPALYAGEQTGYFLPTALELGLDNTARWLITATGTIDGQALSSQCFLNWTPFEAVIFTPEAANDADVIPEINTFLSTLTPNANTTIIINLPSGEFSGYIDIPQYGRRLNVNIEGAGSDQTTIIGGIYSNDVKVAAHVYGVNFIGAGASNQNWGSDPDRPNRGIYGASMGSADVCVFTGYDYALYSRDCYECEFYDNNVAVCIDHAVAESNGIMNWNWFENNSVAIEFKNVLSSRAMSTFSIVENCFVSNTKDIQDDVQRNIFVPGCYFADRINGTLTVRECRTDEHVMYYPQAANTEFTEFIYDTDWYDVDKIVICANFTATFPIPAEYLDGDFTIMNSDGTAKLGSWSFGGRGGRR